MRAILRYNNYMYDNISDSNPGFAISSRFDLESAQQANPFYARAAFGGVDSKVIS